MVGMNKRGKIKKGYDDGGQLAEIEIMKWDMGILTMEVNLLRD